MAPTVTIYHNPRCSKSRQTLDLLEQHGLTPTVINYLQQPPSADELQELLSLLGLSARELMRKGESEYQALALDQAERSEAELIAAMVAHPILIERPIVIYGNKAVIGRPPERVLELL